MTKKVLTLVLVIVVVVIGIIAMGIFSFSKSISQYQEEYAQSPDGKLTEKMNTPSLHCKKYIPSITQFCPDAAEVDPWHVSREDFKGTVMEQFARESMQGFLETCTWSIDVGKYPYDGSMLILLTIFENSSYAQEVHDASAQEIRDTLKENVTKSNPSLQFEGVLLGEYQESVLRSEYTRESLIGSSKEFPGEYKIVRSQSRVTDEVIVKVKQYYVESAGEICDTESVKNLLESVDPKTL